MEKEMLRQEKKKCRKGKKKRIRYVLEGKGSTDLKSMNFGLRQ